MSDDRRYAVWAREEGERDWHRQFAHRRTGDPRPKRRNRNGTTNRTLFIGKYQKDDAVRQLRERGLQAKASRVNAKPKSAYPNATHYSRHFSRSELGCKCGCKTPTTIQRRLRKTAIHLERFSRELGALQGKTRTPVGVYSGYRCAAHNKAVGGAIASQHLTGKAADLVVPKGKQEQYVQAAKRVPAFRGGGIGVYPGGGVHVDWRGWIARWSSFIGQ